MFKRIQNFLMSYFNSGETSQSNKSAVTQSSIDRCIELAKNNKLINSTQLPLATCNVDADIYTEELEEALRTLQNQYQALINEYSKDKPDNSVMQKLLKDIKTVADSSKGENNLSNAIKVQEACRLMYIIYKNRLGKVQFLGEQNKEHISHFVLSREATEYQSKSEQLGTFIQNQIQNSDFDSEQVSSTVDRIGSGHP